MTTSAYFSRARNLRRLHEGPLDVYIDVYASRLVREGYRRPTAWRCLRLIGDFSRWLELRQLGVSNVDEETVARYLADSRIFRWPTTRAEMALFRVRQHMQRGLHFLRLPL